MTEAQILTEKLIFTAMMKALTEQATYLTGEFRLKLKQDFNTLVKQCDHLISDMESRQTDEMKQYVQDVTDVYHNITIELRKEANKLYESLCKEKV